MKRIILIAIFGLLGGLTLLYAALKLYSSVHQPTPIEQKKPNELQVTGIDSASVLFDDGSRFRTNLYELEFIAQLPTKTKIPFLILTGRQCKLCDANISIYIHSPSDGSFKTEHQQERYGLPGKLHNWEDGELIAESRAFYGEVFPNNYGVFWYQREHNENSTWVESTYFVGISGDTIQGSFIEAKLDSTLLQANRNLAFEIPGVSMSTEP